MVATRRLKRGRPSFKILLTLGALAGVMIVGFQNCAVDLSATTPGASTSGACGSPPAAALLDLQAVISPPVVQTNCSGCHGSGAAPGGFAVPAASADPTSTAVQSLMYINLCTHGGKLVGVKISGGSHGGGTFPTTGPMGPLYTYLNTYF